MKDVVDPVFYPLPLEPISDNRMALLHTVLLSEALSDQFGTGARVCRDLISNAVNRQHDGDGTDARGGAPTQESSCAPRPGTPILVGHVYDPDSGAAETLRSCALWLNDMGVKVFHALYLARAATEPPADPSSVPDEQFNVRSPVDQPARTV